jgi:tetratricopeptide (TPR) repeat protein
VLLEQGRLPEARAKLEEALKIRKEMGSPSTVGDSILSLSKVAFEEGNVAEAEKLARDSAAQFASVKEVDDEVSASALLARSLLAQGKLSEAQTIARQSLSHKINTLPSRFDFSIAAAVVQAASGDPFDAQKQLENLIAETKKLHFIGHEFDARLELGRIQMRSGQAAAAKAELSSLERDARAGSYLLIARKAAAARKATVTEH